MEKTIGKTDAIIRVIVGLVSIYLAFVYSVWWVLVAIAALATAYTRKCGLYSILGISTCKIEKPVSKKKKK